MHHLVLSPREHAAAVEQDIVVEGLLARNTNIVAQAPFLLIVSEHKVGEGSVDRCVLGQFFVEGFEEAWRHRLHEVSRFQPPLVRAPDTADEPVIVTQLEGVAEINIERLAE